MLFPPAALYNTCTATTVLTTTTPLHHTFPVHAHNSHPKVRLLSPDGEASSKGQVTNLLLSPDGKTVAAGYSSGLVLLFSLHTGATAITLHGHRSAVTAGRYHSSGALLASGSADTDIVVWDTVAESGLYRLRGHRDGVTDVVFLEGEGGGKLRNGLASCSKDTLVKLWDLDTQSCVQTVVGHRGEVSVAGRIGGRISHFLPRTG